MLRLPMPRCVCTALVLMLTVACEAKPEPPREAEVQNDEAISAPQPTTDQTVAVEVETDAPADQVNGSTSVGTAATHGGATNTTDGDADPARDGTIQTAPKKGVPDTGSAQLGVLSGEGGALSDLGGLGLSGAARGGGGLSERGIGLGNIGTNGPSRGGRGGSGYGKRSGSGYVGPRIHIGRPQVRGAMPRYESSGTEDYRHYGTNRFTDPAKDPLSTFAADVDTGSYTIARRKLNAGVLPPEASIRVEEFVNYFGYSYPAPANDAFAVSLEAAPSPFSAEPNRYVMRVGVQGKRVTQSERKPVHLTFLVDVSGSMQSRDKIGLVKKSLKFLTQNLSENDTVAISTYAGGVRKVLDPTSMARRGEILAAIDQLQAGGSTAMNDGLKLAYELALAGFEKDHVNRVIVLSDGDANVGPSSHEEILRRIRSYVDEGVTLSTIGFGMGNYKDTLMEQLANKGNGNYYYVDSFDEARKIFGEQMNATLQVIAKDVKLQVEFDADAVAQYRLIGYENRDIADRDFRDDTVDAGEIGAGHTVTALYELELRDPTAARIATVRVRHKEPTENTATEREFVFGGADVRPSVGKASADFQWATAVAGFAELLRKSPYAAELSWELILEVARASTRGRADRREMVKLIEKASRIRA